jgi:hypothetical protein
MPGAPYTKIRRGSLVAGTTASISLLVACSTVPPEELNAARDAYNNSIPICGTAKECEAKWAAARNWMLEQCGLRLQHIEQDYLETYKSGDYANTDLYCRVTKTPISEAEYRIELTAGANNPLMYSAPALLKIQQHFNDRVNNAWAPSR